MEYSVCVESGSGCEYQTKEDLLKEISLMIDDCINNGGTFFSVCVESDASCYYEDDD